MSDALEHGSRILVAGGGIGGPDGGHRAAQGRASTRRPGAPSRPGGGRRGPLAVAERRPSPARPRPRATRWPRSGLEPAGGALRLADGRVLATLPGGQLGRAVRRADARSSIVPTSIGAAACRAAAAALLRDGELDRGRHRPWRRRRRSRSRAASSSKAPARRRRDGVRSLVRERLWGDAPAAAERRRRLARGRAAGRRARRARRARRGAGACCSAPSGCAVSGSYWFASLPPTPASTATATRRASTRRARRARFDALVAAGGERSSRAPTRTTIIRSRCWSAPSAPRSPAAATALLGRRGAPDVPEHRPGRVSGDRGCRGARRGARRRARPARRAGTVRPRAPASRREDRHPVAAHRSGGAASLAGGGGAAQRRAALHAAVDDVRSLAPIVGHRATTP